MFASVRSACLYSLVLGSLLRRYKFLAFYECTKIMHWLYASHPSSCALLLLTHTTARMAPFCSHRLPPLFTHVYAPLATFSATDFSSPDKPARPAFTYRFMANAKQYTVELFLSGRILTVHCNDEIVCGGNLRSNDVFVFYVCSLSLKQVKCEVRAGGDGELSLYAITGNSTIQIQPFTKVGIVIEVVPEFERGESKENEVNPFDVDGEDFVEEEKREETEEGKEDQAAAAVAAAAAGAKTCVLPRGVEDAGDGTFDARIRDHNNKYRWLGNFPTPDQASEVYERARDDKGARGESSRRK